MYLISPVTPFPYSTAPVSSLSCSQTIHGSPVPPEKVQTLVQHLYPINLHQTLHLAWPTPDPRESMEMSLGIFAKEPLGTNSLPFLQEAFCLLLLIHCHTSGVPQPSTPTFLSCLKTKTEKVFH